VLEWRFLKENFRGQLTSGALKVSKTENVDSTALSIGGQASSAKGKLALRNSGFSSGSGHGDCSTGEESDGCEELHVDCVEGLRR
jgi:hypothetical protein